MNKIRVGLIGGGEGSFIGSIHYRAALMDGCYELVCGAFSSDAQKCREAGERYHVSPERAYSSWEDMFDKENGLPADNRMEAVIIATPNHLHHPQAMAALEKGFHVICDKPVAVSLAQALEMERKVGDTGLLFALTYTYTGYAMIKEARHIVSEGRLGKIRKVVVEYPQGWLSEPVEHTGNKQAGWRLDPEFSGPGGCLGDIGVHAQNLAEYVSGLEITEIYAEITSFVSGRVLDDDVSVLLRFENGAKGLMYASQISAGEENNLKVKVYGEKGGQEWQQHEPNTLLLRMSDQPVQILRAGVNYSYLSERTRWNLRLPGGHPEGYIEALANIYRNVAADINSRKTNTRPYPEFIEYPSISDGVRGMLFIEKTLESAQREKWVLL